MRNLNEFTRDTPKDADGNPLDNVMIDRLIGQDITITSAKVFSNDKGDGVTFTFKFEEEGPEFYTTTHAAAITRILGKPEVQEILSTEPMAARIAQVDSSKNNGRRVYQFV